MNNCLRQILQLEDAALRQEALTLAGALGFYGGPNDVNVNPLVKSTFKRDYADLNLDQVNAAIQDGMNSQILYAVGDGSPDQRRATILARAEKVTA
jgi:hypothetical protein